MLKLCVLFRISIRCCVDLNSIWTGSYLANADRHTKSAILYTVYGGKIMDIYEVIPTILDSLDATYCCNLSTIKNRYSFRFGGAADLLDKRAFCERLV